jgi:hypothetical protein
MWRVVRLKPRTLHRDHAQHEAQSRGRPEQQFDGRAEHAQNAEQRDQGRAEFDQRVVE